MIDFMNTSLVNERVLADINRKRTLILIVFLVLILALVLNAFVFWDQNNHVKLLTEALKRCDPKELCNRLPCTLNG